MAQQQSPWLEAKYGWNFGESNWNTGVDENLLKFSFLFDRNVDSVTASLPAAVNGQAHYLTTDNRLYFAVGTTYFSSPVPKWFIVYVRGTGQTHQFNGTALVQIDTPAQLNSRLAAVELTVSTLGTAAFKTTEFFASKAQLDVASATAAAYTDTLRTDVANTTTLSKGAGQVGFNPALAYPADTVGLRLTDFSNTSDVAKGSALIGRNAQVVNSVAALRTLLKTSPSKFASTAGYYLPGDFGKADYYLDEADATSVDNGGTIIVANDGGRWKLMHNGRVDVAQFGVTYNATDSRASYQKALDWAGAGRTLTQSGDVVTSGQLTIINSGTEIHAVGSAKILAQANSVFEFMLLGTSLSDLLVVGLEFDANRANRTTGQNVRYMGAAFLTCTDSAFVRCTARNCIGYNNIPGVGLAIAGGSTRGLLAHCRLLNNGGTSGTDAADGIFTSGEQNLIVECQAYNCTDTGFVIETSDHSGIIGCTAMFCAAVAAITNASTADKRGNFISGLTGRNWNASNTGGIQIGVPTATAGNLLDTVLSGVVMMAETATYGNGAAINIRRITGGKVIGLTIDSPRINGSRNQGILVDGDDVLITNPAIKGTTDSCIQFQTGTANNEISGGSLAGGSYGIITAGTAIATAKNVTTTGQGSGQYFAFGTSLLTVRSPVISATPAAYGNDAGAKVLAATTGREFALPYSASIDTDAQLGDVAIITATNNSAFTLNSPTNNRAGQRLTYRIRNTSGGALGAVTWGAGFVLSAWTSPATGFNRSITFKYDGSLYVEESRTTADIPN